ncbi:MAG: lysylphosphatidylglycerol synthase transmembrane domain-containing protein [Cyclonatronaceae bacterium]
MQPTNNSIRAGDHRSYFSYKYLFISLLLSISSLALVLYLTYTPDGFQHLKLKRLPGLFIAFFVAVLKVWFSAAKIRFLADKQIGWWASVRVVLAWDFASAITPSTIGGAPLGTYVMTRENITLGKSSAIVLYGLLLDQFFYMIAIPVLLISAIYIDVVPENVGWVGEGVMLVIYALLMGYGLLLGYGLLRDPGSLKKVLRYLFTLPVLNRMKVKIEPELDNLVNKSEELRKKPPSFLIKGFMLSNMVWLCKIWLPTIVVLSFLPADELLSFMRSLAMMLASLFMPTPGGSGGVEGLFAIFQGPLMERQVFLGIAIFMWRLITYYLSIPVGMFVMSWYVNKSVIDSYSTLAGREKAQAAETDDDELTNVSEDG